MYGGVVDKVHYYTTTIIIMIIMINSDYLRCIRKLNVLKLL